MRKALPRVSAGEPSVDVREHLLACRLRGPRPPDRAPGQLGQLEVGETVHGARDLVLRAQPRAEQQRVVRPQRDLRAGLDKLAQRHVLRRPVHTERDVAAGADLEGDVAAYHLVQDPWVLDTADAVSESVGGQSGQRLSDRRCPEQLTSVRHAGQSGTAGNVERDGELGGDSTAFVIAQTESDHMSGAITGVARGQASQSPCIQRVPDPVCGHDDRDTDPGLFGG